MYITGLTIDNFRCFDHAEVQFQYPGRPIQSNENSALLPNINLLLGNNGSGKSATLKAIALSVLAPVIQSSGFRPHLLVRRTGIEYAQKDPTEGARATVKAEIQTQSQDSYPTPESWNEQSSNSVFSTALFQRYLTTESVIPSSDNLPQPDWKGIFDDNSPAFFMTGYGATRRVDTSPTFDPSSQDKSRSRRYQRVASIFEDHLGLTPIHGWLQEIRSRNRETEGMELLNHLLPNEVKYDSETKDDILFRVNSTLLPFSALSDGYRAFIGWTVDLIYQLCQVTPIGHQLCELTGVVMVDEIDLHLHPEWQRVVVETVAKNFPNLQFFFTTHSPIVTGTLEAANIYIAEPDENGLPSLRQGTANVHGMSSDQILSGSYFGLPTSRSGIAVEKMNVLAEEAWSGDKEASLKYLKLLSQGLESFPNEIPIASEVNAP